MIVTTLQQGIMVYICWADYWDVVGVLGRWTILLTSHWVEAIVLIPVKNTIVMVRSVHPDVWLVSLTLQARHAALQSASL